MVGCGAPGPSGTPSPTPAGFGRVEHPIGPTDIVLRYDEGGGFIGPAFFATHVPIFTLYGDGTVLFRDPMKDPLPSVGNLMPQRPLRIVRLTEEQIQSTLIFAIGEGGLGTARLDYRNDRIADASTAVFTLKAGGLDKRVSVYALGLDVPGMPDALPRAAFARLAARLAGFHRGGTLATQDYVPERYRGILLDGQPGDPDTKPWPWDDITPSDFVAPSDPDSFGLPSHILTAAQVEALGIGPYPGGFGGVTLGRADEGAFYSFSLRPLLPDEAE
jgi:hypothetical protein